MATTFGKIPAEPRIRNFELTECRHVPRCRGFVPHAKRDAAHREFEEFRRRLILEQCERLQQGASR
jgi:hypothetical protein